MENIGETISQVLHIAVNVMTIVVGVKLFLMMRRVLKEHNNSKHKDNE